MARNQTLIPHGPWSAVRTTSHAGEESPTLLYDALNYYITDAPHHSGIAQRPPITVQHDPKNGRVGQAIHDYFDSRGMSYRFLVRGGHLEIRDGTLAGSVFTDVTPTNVQIDPTAKVFLTTFADRLLVNDGVNVPWAYDPATLTATRIPFTTPTTLLSRGAPDKTVAVASTTVTLSGLTNTRASAGVAISGIVSAATWGVFRVSVSSTGVFTVTAQAGTQSWANEPTALQFLPDVPAGQWDLGYFTVKAAGANWTGGTDALAGGASGTPANTTNYYAPAYTSWTARGAPVVYSGQCMFIIDRVAGTAAQATIAWSEIDAPLVGYQQTNYDNLWSLTQTSAEPLWALAATNEALYYFRRTAIGQITGAISRTWRTDATLDTVSTTIGSTAAASVKVVDDFVWFVSDGGLPHRFRIGTRTMDPLWRQMREWIFALPADDATVTLSNTPYAMAAYQPELKLVVIANRSDHAVSPTTPIVSQLYVFDAETGAYQGRWVGGATFGFDAMGVTHEYTGLPYLAFLGASDLTTTNTTRGAFFVQWRVADISPSTRSWSDTGATAMVTSATLGRVLGDDGSNLRFDRLRLRVRVGTAAMGDHIRRFQVSIATPWSNAVAVLTPTLSSTVVADRVAAVGLGITGRWLRPTISGPVIGGDLLTESGDLLTTEAGDRLALTGTDSPLFGQAVLESVEVTAHHLGRDPMPM